MMKKTALITGGNRGIGRSLVQAFKNKGYVVVSVSRTLPASATDDLVIACDVAAASDVCSLFEKLDAKGITLDVLINNAGIAGENSLEPDDDDAAWHRIIAVDLHGPYYMSKQALSRMHDGGCIINIASVLGHRGVAEQTAYCAAKHGLIGFTKALAKHAVARSIRVNAISPGWVDTDMATSRMQEMQVSPQELTDSIPLGHLLQGDEVAELALFLAGPGGRSITGQSYIMDSH